MSFLPVSSTVEHPVTGQRANENHVYSALGAISLCGALHRLLPEQPESSNEMAKFVLAGKLMNVTCKFQPQSLIYFIGNHLRARRQPQTRDNMSSLYS